MGKSKPGPSFFTSAGAKLMVERHKGDFNPEMVRGVERRSRDSFAAASGRPTIAMLSCIDRILELEI